MTEFPVWGIHVTAASVRGVKIERSGDRLRVIAHDQIDFTEDIDDINSLERHAALAHALAVFSKRHELSKCRVWVSVDASSSFNRFVTAPMVQGESLMRILSYEAQQHIPFALDAVHWDHKVLEVRQEDGEADVILFALKKEVVEERLRRLTKQHFPVDGVQLAPVALYNFAVHEHLAKDGYVIVSVDFDRIDIVLCHHKRFWFRSLPAGVHTMFDDLQASLDVKHRLLVKILQGEKATDDMDEVEAVRTRAAEELASEISRLVAYYAGAIEGVELRGILMVPGSPFVPALSRHLKAMTGLDVYAVKSFRHIDIDPDIVTPEISKSIAKLAHATGLALQGLGESEVDVRLFDSSVERVIAGRRILYVVAVLMVFLLVWLMWRDVDSAEDELRSRSERLDALIGEVEASQQAYQQLSREKDIKDAVLPLVESGRRRLAPLTAVDAVLDTIDEANASRSPDDLVHLVNVETGSSDTEGEGRTVSIILGVQAKSTDEAAREEIRSAVLEPLSRRGEFSNFEVLETFTAGDLAFSASSVAGDRELRRLFVMVRVTGKFRVGEVTDG